MITKESYIIDTFSEKEINYIGLLADSAMMFIDYRRKNGLSQTGLAKKLGISQARVSKIESGDYNFSLQELSDFLFDIGSKLEIKCSDYVTIIKNNTPVAEKPGTSWYGSYIFV